MKTFLFPWVTGVRAATVLTTCSLAALPLISHAERGDARRGPPDQSRGAPQAPPARPAPAPAPQARVPSAPRAAPQRPAFVPPPSVPKTGFNNGRGQQSVPAAPARPRETYVRPQPAAPVITDRSPGARFPGAVTRPVPSAPPAVTVDRSRDPRYPGGVYRPGTPYTPRGTFDNGRQQQAVPAQVYPRPHRTYVDASRFAHINRNVAYQSYPRHYYRLCYGNGFRGMGWYFGPPNFSYFYEYPGVQFYPSREYIPSTYLSLRYSANSSLDYAIQQALYDRGYYDGPLDGDIGPASRLAIANFQADNGLEPTGIIDETLLRYLQLE